MLAPVASRHSCDPRISPELVTQYVAPARSRITRTEFGFAARALLIDVCSVAIEPDKSLMFTTLSPEVFSMKAAFGTVYSIREAPCPAKAVRGKLRSAASKSHSRDG